MHLSAKKERGSDTALMALAKHFHQDFGMLGMSPSEYAAEWIAAMPRAQKLNLSNQVTQLVEAHSGKSQKGLKNAWRRLGAQWTPEDLTLLLRDVEALCKA